MSVDAARTPPRRLAIAVLALSLVVLFVVRLVLVYRLNPNWDELHFLSKVHTYQRGELTGKLLTFHVHLFGWVTQIAHNEVRQVLHLREAMVLCALATAGAVFAMGRRLLASTPAALFAVCLGQSFSNVMAHGTSARFDPIVTALFLVSAALVVTERTTGPSSERTTLWARLFASRRSLTAGVLMAIALLVSIKVVLFVPTIVALVAVRHLVDEDGASRVRTGWRAAAGDVGGFLVALVVAAAGLLALHTASLASVDPNALPTAKDADGGLRAIFEKMMMGPRFPAARYIIATMRWDFYFWLLWVAGACVLWVAIGAGGSRRRRALELLALSLPLSSLVLYRNAFPYFYVCMVPGAALMAAAPLAAVDRWLATRARWAAVVVILALLPAANLVRLFWRYNSVDETVAQLRTVEAVHTVFPTPVRYIDRCAMVGSFPKVGPFMTTWTLSDYRRRGVPVMADLLVQKQPQMLLANVETLDLGAGYLSDRTRRLLPEDFIALRNNFVPYWGPIWVAGKTLHLRKGEAEFEIVITGRYVVDAKAPVTIDGAAYQPGAVVELNAGKHALVMPTLLPGAAGTDSATEDDDDDSADVVDGAEVVDTDVDGADGAKADLGADAGTPDAALLGGVDGTDDADDADPDAQRTAREQRRAAAREAAAARVVRLRIASAQPPPAEPPPEEPLFRSLGFRTSRAAEDGEPTTADGAAPDED